MITIYFKKSFSSIINFDSNEFSFFFLFILIRNKKKSYHWSSSSQEKTKKKNKKRTVRWRKFRDLNESEQIRRKHQTQI